MAASSPELLKILPENQESETKENEEETQQYLLEKEDDVQQKLQVSSCFGNKPSDQLTPE